MAFLKKIRSKLSSFQIIIIGFAVMIIIGALLLMLPIASQSHTVTPFDKTLFTSTSAVCVTGLIVEDTATHWSAFGQIIILILIQIGGLGVITIGTLLTMLAGKKIGLMQRQTMQNAISAPQVGGILKLTRFVIKASFIIEGAGILLLLPAFCGQYGAKGIWKAIFTSISAFCNAGFDLMGSETGKFSSLTGFADNIYVMVIIMLLIIIGGIGFLTWEDFVKHKFRFKEYRMQSKVIIVTSAILVFAPAAIFYFTDFSTVPVKEGILESLFQSVTTRTAGFNTVDLAAMTSPGKMIMMALMLVGGSPGSTAGGMKTTTLAVLFANALSVFRKRKHAHFFKRRVDDSVVKCASAILFLYISLSVFSAIVINLMDKVPMRESLFETISAVGTVGVTLGITPQLGIVSHIILMILMFLGRVGGLTIIYAAFKGSDKVTSMFPVENITVG